MSGGYPLKEKVADLLEESRTEAEEYKRATDFRLADMEVPPVQACVAATGHSHS